MLLPAETAKSDCMCFDYQALVLLHGCSERSTPMGTVQAHSGMHPHQSHPVEPISEAPLTWTCLLAFQTSQPEEGTTTAIVLYQAILTAARDFGAELIPRFEFLAFCALADLCLSSIV